MRQPRSVRGFLFEAAAVLAGILAAFGLDAAWEARGDRVRAEVYAAALSAELQSNREHVEVSLASFDEDRPRLQEFFRDVIAEDNANQDQILDMIRHVGPESFAIERVALADLLNSGGLESFRDPAVRRAIGMYDLRLTGLVEARERFALHWENVMSPYYMDHASLPGMFNQLGSVMGGYQFPADRFDFDEAAFAGNRDFANRFAVHLYRREIVRRAEERLLVAIDSLVAELNGGHEEASRP